MDPVSQKLQAERLERALRSSLQSLQSATLGRDIATLNVDQQRKLFFQKQINEILDRMKSQSAIDALSSPLTETYMGGFSRNPLKQVPDGSSLFGDRVLANFSIDTDKLKALTNAVVNPLQSAGNNLHSPLPYIAPSLDPMGIEKMLEIATKGAAQGSSWAELAKEISTALPGAAKLVKDQLRRGYQVEFPSGYRMPAERYAKVLARTTSVWAGNRGALDRATENGNPCMLVNVSPGTCDFCVALEGKVYALSAEASAKYDVPMLAACPNGGPPFHVNCRHALAPFTPRRADAGKLPKADPSLLTRAEGKGAANSAQKAYEAILTKDPLQFADQIAETAARRGFGDAIQKTPADLAGKDIPDSKNEFVAAEKFSVTGKFDLAEDVNLARRNEAQSAAGKPDMTREEYRAEIAQTLRKAKDRAFDDEGQMYYYHAAEGNLAVVDAKTANVTQAKPITPDEWKALRAGLKGPQAPVAAPAKPAPIVTAPPLTLPKPVAKPKPKAPKPAPVVAPVPVALKPNGPAVSAASDIQTTLVQAKQVTQALKNIDSIHGDGSLTQIPVVTTYSGRALGSYASYATRPDRIKIRTGGTDEGTRETFTHETGHFLDHMGIPSLTKFASEDPLSALKPVMDAIQTSSGFKSLDAEYAKLTHFAPATIQQHLDYLKKPQEQFARAYSQFIGEESADTAVLNYLAGPLNVKDHWTSADFAPIKEAMRKAFKGLGWMK